jgi:transcriptional regulator with XRE-family HTH domain
MSESWRAALRDAREAIRISRVELASNVGVSPETIRGYEKGRARPTRARLEALIEALKIPNGAANEIRQSIGYTLVPTVHQGPNEEHRYYTADELDGVVETVPWPEFVVNDPVEVVAANSTVQALWRIDFAHERKVRTRAQMNLLAVASATNIGDRVKNWEEIVGILVSIFKANTPAPYSLDAPTPYFEEVVRHFASGAPAFLSRLFDVWNRAEPMQGKIRWTYPVIWLDPDVGELRFLATVSLANEEHSTFFNDWHPIDAATWEALERVKARGIPRPRRRGTRSASAGTG